MTPRPLPLLLDLARRLDDHGEAVLVRCAAADRLPRPGWISRLARDTETVDAAIRMARGAAALAPEVTDA